jgi:aspartate-semialdehyde dehydrogenase
MTVVATAVDAIPSDVKLLFSALPGSTASVIEEELAAAGFAVASNASAHRMDADVPLLIPDVNPEHTALIPVQQARRGWSGFIVTNPNCTTTHLVCALKPLHDAFGLQAVNVVTMQALSGAGYPGVSALDILDNVVPYISGEEEKIETEPRKLLGTLMGDAIEPAGFVVSAQANRVAVRNSHLHASEYCLPIERSEAVSTPTSNQGCCANNWMNLWPTAPVAPSTPTFIFPSLIVLGPSSIF